MILAWLSVVVAAVPSGNADGHYAEATRCYYVARYIGITDIRDAPKLSVNKPLGLRISARYLPILSFEGYQLGKTGEQILDDLRDEARRFSAEMTSRMNSLPPKGQTKLYNDMVAQTNDCNRMPILDSDARSNP